MGHRAEELLLSIPEIQTVARKTGRAELDEHALGVNVSEIEAPFELKDRSRNELMADVREKLGTITEQTSRSDNRSATVSMLCSAVPKPISPSNCLVTT